MSNWPGFFSTSTYQDRICISVHSLASWLQEISLMSKDERAFALAITGSVSLKNLLKSFCNRKNGEAHRGGRWWRQRKGIQTRSPASASVWSGLRMADVEIWRVPFTFRFTFTFTFTINLTLTFTLTFMLTFTFTFTLHLHYIYITSHLHIHYI